MSLSDVEKDCQYTLQLFFPEPEDRILVLNLRNMVSRWVKLTKKMHAPYITCLGLVSACKFEYKANLIIWGKP